MEVCGKGYCVVYLLGPCLTSGGVSICIMLGYYVKVMLGTMVAWFGCCVRVISGASCRVAELR